MENWEEECSGMKDERVDGYLVNVVAVWLPLTFFGPIDDNDWERARSTVSVTTRSKITLQNLIMTKKETKFDETLSHQSCG